MNVKAIYNHHLIMNNNNKNLALKEAMKEITNIVNESNVDDEFMNNYYNAKKYLLILNIVSPGLIFGLSTGAIISLLNLNIQIINISVFLIYLLYILFILIIGATIFYFISAAVFAGRVKCILYPYYVRVMEIRIDEFNKT